MSTLNPATTRRDLLRTAMLGGMGLAAAGLLPAGSAAQAAEPLALKGHLKHSVARWTLPKYSVAELCQMVKGIGFAAIDLIGPEDWPTLKEYGVHSSMCNGAEISLEQGFAETQYHDELVERYTRHIDLVADAGYRNLICFSGNRNGMDPEQGLRNAEAGLKRILGHAEKRGVMLVMELLNSKVDHEDYLCDHTEWGVALCKRLGSRNFGLLYDIYHMQIMEGDIIATIGKYHEYFAHYHTAGVPGRHEIDDTQELYYPAICRAITATGFDGYFAQEFIPAGADPAASLRDAVRICDV